ncbi:DUF2278 family protein [Actinoplanes sp. NPDC049118]|uniref:DUF2278 family protein n=1 Tax=Actinoplanes sp. NPDC049118 TaxID=3155769 RepID=UPI0033C1E5CA
MAGGYGVLRADLDRWVREDDQSTPHLQIRALDRTGQPWRIAVNVQSDTGSEVVYWLVDPLLGHPVLAGLAALPTGFSTAHRSPASALDYVRAPLFDWRAGTALPASGSASADDLQDLLALHLQQCRNAGGELFAFGSRFDRNLHKPIDAQFGNTDGLHGIHNIHLNQGNTGRHADDNGTLQDGGLILAHPDRHVGLFLAFQTQRVPTDDDGGPAAQSRLIGELIAGRTPPAGPPAADGPVYLERALLNPSGDDAGKEVVVVGNLANASVRLDGWQLVDRNRRVTTIGGLTVSPGGSALIALDGTGVQLSNAGGNLVLLDHAGRQIDAVVFTAADTAAADRFIRFAR